MRSKGLPVLGSGAVFPFKDEDIMIEDITPERHWKVIASLDFSSVNDASVVCYSAYNPDNDTYYVFDAVFITNIEQKNPRYMAQCILDGSYPTIPVVSPHDGGINSVSPESKAKIMKGMGVNILGKSFYNPTTLTLAFHKGGGIEREPGLTEMRRMMEEGRFKVCRRVSQFFKEKAQLFYAPSANGGMKCVGNDDMIDAARYGVISLRGNRGVSFSEVTRRFNDGFDNPFQAQEWAY